MTPEPVGSTHLRFDDARVRESMYVVTECCSEFRMRSRTSRGVPEWSGGEDLYMGSHHTVTGNIWGVYRDHRRGSGGPPGGSTCPGGPYGLYVERDQPLSGLGAFPLGPPAEGGTTAGERGTTAPTSGTTAPLTVLPRKEPKRYYRAAGRYYRR